VRQIAAVAKTTVPEGLFCGCGKKFCGCGKKFPVGKPRLVLSNVQMQKTNLTKIVESNCPVISIPKHGLASTFEEMR